MELQAVNQRSGGEHKGLFSLFSIKPYKNRLLTPGAGYWIACVHLVVFVMATSEAIAWGYLGSLFGKGAVGYVAAVIAFLFMFAIIWVIDVSFVTMDLSRSYYDRLILKQDTEKWQDRARMGAGLTGRILIVVVSLTISAPFLSQIVFKQDIDNEIHRRNLANVSAVRDSILSEKDAEIVRLDSLIEAREADLVQETAGRGSSGNYGFGPVTQTMERNLERLRGEREQAVRNRLDLESTLQNTSLADLAGQYNINLVDNGVQAREAVMGSLMDNAEYRTAKRAVTAFLAFIFAALVLLKLFQPRSVRIYYNEKLQDLYREYLAGNLNRWIAKEERSNDGEPHMSPLRFEDWCINTYGVVRNEDIKRRESRKIYNLFKMKIEQLEEEKGEIKQLLEPIETEFDEIMKDVSRIKIELLQADGDIAQCARNEDDIAGQLASIDDDLSNSRFRGSDVLIAVTAKKDLEEKRAAHKTEAIALQHRRNLILHKLDVKETEAGEIEKLIDKIRANYRDIQDKIDAERLAYTEMIVAGRVVDFPRPEEALEAKGEAELAYDEATRQTENPAEIMAERFGGAANWGMARELETVDKVDTADEVDDLNEETANQAIEPSYAGNVAEPGKPEPIHENESPISIQNTVTDNELEDKNDALPWDMDESEPLPAPGAALFDPAGELPAEDDPAAYDEDSPVEFVDDERLNEYADAASLSAYDEEMEEDEIEDIESRIEESLPLWRLLQAGSVTSTDEDAAAKYETEIVASDTAPDVEEDKFEEEYAEEFVDVFDDDETASPADVIEEFLRRRDAEAFARHGKGLPKGTFGRAVARATGGKADS